MFYRKELVDFSKDTEETRLCVKIAGESLVGGPFRQTRIVVKDDTKKGRDSIKKLIQMGFRVESIKD